MKIESVEIYNPENLPIEELPFIWGFNNGGSDQWWHAQLISQEGMGLGSHLCSHENFMPGDLGVLKGYRPDRHETFREYYPKGYRMDFVPLAEVESHEGLKEAFRLNKILAEEAALKKAKSEK